MLSPDEDFSLLGDRTHINYLKVFRAYRDMLIERGDTPAHHALIDLFNASLFGDTRTVINNATCGGDGESEEEMNDYFRRLKGSTDLPNHADINRIPNEEPTVDSPPPPTLSHCFNIAIPYHSHFDLSNVICTSQFHHLIQYPRHRGHC